MNTKTPFTLALLLALAAAGVALAADPAPSGAGAASAGPAVGAGRGAGPGTGMGAGMGAGRRGGAARWGSDFTPGWALMTPDERNAHRDQMRTMTSRSACQAYVAEHHQQMVARAQARQLPLPTPRRDPCAGLAP